MTLLTPTQTAAALHRLSGWQRDGEVIVRRIETTGFATALMAANLAAFVSEQQRHHADIRFGWGYCELRWTTHDAGGLTKADIEAATRFNAAFDVA